MKSSTNRALVAKKQSTSFAQVANNLLNVLQGCSKSIRLLLVMFLTLTVSATAWGAGTETFEKAANSASYGSVSWTGVNGLQWSASSFRTDQKISGNRGLTSKASTACTITMPLTSVQQSEGMGVFTFKYKYPFSDSGKKNNLSFIINGTTYTGTVSYNSNAQTVNITVNQSNLPATITINIASGGRACFDDFSWTSYVSANPHTVTFHTTATAETPLTEASAGDGVIPPTMEQECSGWTFRGWSESPSNSETSTTELELVTLTNGKYYPTEDVNLYPVYTKTTNTGGTTFDKYTKVDLGGTITSGKYLISTGSYTMAGNGNTGVSFSPGSTEKTTYEYTITIDGDYFTIKGPDGKYVGGKDGTSLAFGTTVANDSYRWKYVNYSGIQNKSYTTRHIKAFGTTDFRHYTTSYGTLTYLYKRTEKSSGSTYYYSYPSCTTEATVTLNPNGGAISEDGWETTDGGDTYTKNVETTSDVTLPTPTKDGYEFGGWYENSTFSGSAVTEIEAGTTGTKEFYAKWTCVPPVFDIKIKEDNPVVFSGESIELTVVGSNIAADATYQWYKKNGENYDELTGQTANKLTIAEATANDAGNYKCVVTNGTCSAENDFTVKMYSLRGLIDWSTDCSFTKVNATTATYSMELAANSSYQFKVYDGSAYYGNEGDNPTMTSANCTNWTMRQNTGNNVTLQTTAAGTYTFTLNYTDASNPTISVTYPAKRIVYLEPGVWYTGENQEKFVVHAWYSSTVQDILMTKIDDCAGRNIYQAEIDANHEQVIFIRVNPAGLNLSNPWSNEWNRTKDLTLISENQFTITTWGGTGEWNNSTEKSNGEWTTFTPNYTVTFDANGHGTNPADQCIVEGGKATQPTPAPTATGYTFGGWYKEAGCANAWDFANDVVTEDITLYAKWTINPHTVTWKPAGGNWSGDANDIVQTYQYGAAIEAPEKPTYDCYEFVEWEPTYTADMTMPDEDLVFTAVWDKPSYTITFKNYDDIVLQTSTVECGETPSYTGATPTREQTAQYTYTFNGWSSTIAPATQDQVYTAQFNEVTRSYTVTWMVGTTEYTAGTPTNQVEYDKKVTNLPTSPQDDAIGTCANKFIGWSTKSSGSNAENADYYDDLFTTAENSPAITDATTFYAVFATKGSGGIAQGTVLWAENFGHFDTKKPSEAGTGTGTTIYGDASITYSQSSNNTKGYNDEAYAGGTLPELLLYKGGSHTWTIAGIPTGGAAKMTLSFLSNRTEFNVTSSTPGITINGSETAWNIEADSDVTNFTLTIKNTSEKNARLDNVSVVVAEGGVSYSNYVTNCCNTPAPTNGTYTSPSGTSVTLTWDGESTQYHITGEGLDDYSTEESYTITDLTECNEYTFYVSAHPAEGCESAAIQISAQPFSGAKTVTFNPNGGSVSPTSFTTSCTNQSIKLPPTPTYSGYRFMGWFTAANGGTEITGTSYTPTADITLFAHWEKEYTVTYDLQGGTASPVCSGDKYIAGEIVTICTSTPIKSGYRFTGWRYAPDVTITNGQFAMPASNVTITAEFVARSVTNIEVATNTHRVLMQGSAFIGEQIRVTYDNGETELLEWNNSKLTFAGHNTNELGVQTVTVTYTGEGTAHTQYNIEVIDGLGITFWDDDYTETIKYEPGDLVDVDNKIGKNICSGWEFVGWSETQVANKSNGFTPVRNFNATDAKVLYAVYVQTSTDWISAYNIDELHPGAKYVIVAHYSDLKEYALTNTNNTNSSYLDGANLTTDCEQVREGDAYPYKDRYKLKVTPDENWKWQLVNTGSGWTMRNISANKYLKINTDKSISLTTTPDDKFTLSNGSSDSEITAQSSSDNYLSWYNPSKYWNGHTSGKQYYLTNETNFTSTPPCSPLSATFYGNGGIVTDGKDYHTITEPTRDAGITTPTAYFADCNGKSWTFVGWSREEIDVTRVPVLTTDLLHDGGGNEHYYIQENGEEFWAVYTNIGNPETKYGTITFTDDDVTRQYENAKTITKSVTAMGDYDFELYHVSNASSLGIQFDHNSTPKGYIKNITSLGKINSISLNEFQTGNIDDVKVYVGNTSDAINILLTEADLQQTGTTYTYYPPKNYAYVKIEANNGYCGITSISIDFGKGTQIWATTPDCSTITLSGDEIYVTATNGRAVMAPTTLTVKANQLEANADVILTSNSDDVYFSLDRSFNFAAGQAADQKPKTSLTLPTDAEGNLATTDVYVHYRPSVDGTGIPEDVVVSANLETPNPSITDDHTIHVRNLPAKFVIATKVGATWYALPANMTGDTNPLAEVIEVNETTMTATAPNTSTYTLWPVKTTNGTGNRYADYGDRLRFAAVNYEQRGLWANNNNNSSAIRNYAVINSLGADALAAYEWKVTTTVVDGHWQYTLQTDQDKNQNFLRYWTSAEGTPVGPKWGTYNAGENKLYFLPVTETQPFEYAVVEWYPTKVLIQTDAAITSPTVKVDGEAVASPILTNKGGKLYEISNLPLETNPNKLLQVSFTDDAINYTNTKVVPIILSRGAKTITGEPFATLTQKVYQYADVVVRDGATLSVNGDTDVANTMLGMTIYPTAKVAVAEGYKLSVHNLTFFGGIDEIYDGSTYKINKYGVPQLSLKGILNKTVTTIDYIMRVDLDQMYSLAVPYDVQLADIKYWDGSDIALGSALYVSAYDGEARANQSKKTWIYETDFESRLGAATLKAGVGYTISAELQAGVGNEYSILRMPMMSNVASGATEAAKTVAVTAWGKDANVTDNHKGWNLVGNPYMTAISGGEADTKLVLGYLKETGTGPWEWVEKTYRYVTIPSDDGTYYWQRKFTEAVLPPFKNFFVQIGTTGELAFGLGTRQSMPARSTQAAIEKEVEFEILMSNDARQDNTGLLISEEYSPAYEINADLEKMIGSMSVYTIYGGYKLAYNALSPINASEWIPVGYIVPAAGEYTFRLDDVDKVIDQVAHIYLIDYTTNTVTDLMVDDYQFTTAVGTNDTRFAINVILNSRDNTATGLDNTGVKNDQPIKFIYQDKIYILRNGMIYDTTGKQVITINK